MPEKSRKPSRARLAKIKMVAFDFDGVLTDNRVWVSEKGERSKCFWVPDGVGIFMAHKLGLKFAIITGNDDLSTRHRAEYLRIDEVHMGVRDKGEVYELLKSKYELSDDEIMYLGDDLPDAPIFRCDCLTAAPCDADPQIKKLAGWIASKPGGQGFVREVIDALLDAHDFDWSPQATRQAIKTERLPNR
jgi:YrbI family 3-deoxy-D-manno-octulosonate 8-phosphate phosphatase